MNKVLIIFLLLMNLKVSGEPTDTILILAKDSKYISYKINSPLSDSSFTILINSNITEESKRDFALYYLEVSTLGEARDSNSFSRKNIYTPEMIMDSLTKYRFYYERKNRGRFYVIIKGQGPIWYLHKAMLTYLWSDPGSFNIRKKKGNEMFVTRHYPANAGEALCKRRNSSNDIN